MPDYTNIRTEKARNSAGTKLEFYFAPIDDFDTVAGAPAAPATLAEANVIVDDHVFLTGKNFFKCELELNKNALAGEPIGENLGADEKIEFTGFMSGFGDDQLALSEKIKWERHIALIPLKDGKVMQLGEPGYGVMIRPSGNISAEADGERGFNITVTFYGRWLRYDGAISFTPAV